MSHPTGNPMPPASEPSARRTAVIYLLILAVCVGAFLVIRAYGEGLQHQTDYSTTSSTTSEPSKQSDALLHVLIALAAVILVGRILARLFTYIGQPAVIGEVVAGILFGPSLIGPTASAWILPPSVSPCLSLIAQVGVILYMFLVGLELNLGRLRDNAHITLFHMSAWLCLSCSGAPWHYGSFPASRVRAFPSPALPCLSAWRYRSQPFPYWRAYSLIGA
jgi:hypothetical protein